MSLTFAHPAAVLPFSRESKYVNFLAMVLGSMSPDFEYFLRGMPYGTIGHTFTGFLVLNLPVVVIVYFIYKIWIHQSLYDHLPTILREKPPEKARSSSLLNVIIFLYSALFGMLTHVAWDSFTHLDGLMVRNLSFLTYTVDLFDRTIPVFKLLQHGGTIAGILAILAYIYFRAATNTAEGGAKPRQKWIYWCLIAMLSTLFFSLWYLIDSLTFASFGIIVVRIIDSALISLLVVSIYFRRFVKEEHNAGEN
ncbi:DUF4184 family protein [Gracilibacillus oryzae]|uniref:DUF4184 family protein n=1 Tax=Gracilibacillus oryzae TaxID=1672701 RepID=A0A7C8KY50_9BACI|nr:DUF4184 family protein [Gracilibacillus oryzae]KAB8135697.1 DUF4184 family protein [Gracilibacillus oryzae]